MSGGRREEGAGGGGGGARTSFVGMGDGGCWRRRFAAGLSPCLCELPSFLTPTAFSPCPSRVPPAVLWWPPAGGVSDAMEGRRAVEVVWNERLGGGWMAV